MISASTRKLTGGLFEYRDLGTVSLKGFADTVPVWEVTGLGAAESRFEALRAASTPLVGRDEEIDLLLRRWEQAKRGDGQVVLICGEPGIGKSRIAQTLAERISGEPHIRLRYFCSPHHQDSALYPSIAQLERAAGLRREDTAEERLSKLEAVIAQGTNDLSEAVPLLADLLSIPTGDRYPPFNLSPQKRKEKTLRAQLAQVEGLAARQPVLMVWEDIHWSDPTSRESLDLLIDRVATLRVLVILTFRPEFTPPWTGRPHVTLLTLSRLAPRQRAQMIGHMTGGKSLPKEIADQIVERTDGVPLFIEELTKTVIESGILTEAGGRYAMAGPVAPLAIPTSLHASLLARLDRLAPTREIAQIGAALGRSFSHELISAVAQMPQPQVDGALAQLVNAELIFRRGTPPDAQYTFKHALVQDAAYSTLLRSRRQQIHGRIVATLERQFPDLAAAQPALLAQHSVEAGLAEKAVDCWLKAGQQAVARSAMAEAVSQLQKGLEQLPNLPDDASRQQWELDLRIAFGRALLATRGYGAPLVGETYARAHVLAEQLGRSDYLFPLLYGQCTFHHVRREHQLAFSLAQQMEQVGKTRNDTSMLLMSKTLQGILYFHGGDFLSARAVFERCYAMNDPPQRANHRAACATVTAGDPHVVILTYYAICLAYLGFIDQARAWAREALSEAGQLGHVHSLAWAAVFAAWVECAAGAPREIGKYAEQAISISDEHGFPYWLAWGLLYRGWSMASLGESEQGYALIAKGLSVHRAAGSVVNEAFALVLLAEASAKLGRITEGLKHLADAAQIIESANDRYHEADLHRVRGDLLSAIGDETGADQSYREAITVATHQCAKVFELRAATSLARLWRDHGKRTEAHDLLAPVYGWFTEGFDAPVLKDAKALLDELSDNPALHRRDIGAVLQPHPTTK